MRKRSKYRPKGALLDNMSWVIGGLKRLDQLPNENIIVRSKTHGAMKALVDGVGDIEDAKILIGALNMTEALLTMGIGTDWAEEIHHGHASLLSMCRRAIRTERHLFTGPEMISINTCLEIHDAQLDVVNVAQLEKAMDIVKTVIVNRKATFVAECAT